MVAKASLNVIFQQQVLRRFHAISGAGAVIVAGRFEGVDERIIEARGLTEISIGDYVLSGGEIAAMVLLDAVPRRRSITRKRASSSSISKGLGR